MVSFDAATAPRASEDEQTIDARVDGLAARIYDD